MQKHSLSIAELKGAPLSVLTILFAYLKHGVVAVDTDELVDHSGWKRPTVLNALRLLVSHGYVASLGGQKWMLDKGAPPVELPQPAAKGAGDRP